jgi:hypothetical protein
MSGRDKRKYKRFRSRLPVRYSSMTSAIVYKDLGYAVNASKSGVSILTNRRLELEELLHMWISLPFSKKIQRIMLKGVVRWTKSKGDPIFDEERFSEFNFFSGVEFLNSDAQPQLYTFIDYWSTIAGE